MAVAGSNERRSAPRVEISQLISVGLFREEWIHATSLDISRTGFRIQAAEDLDPGSELFVQFEVDGQVLSANAVVIHVRPTDGGEGIEAGCEFTSFNGDSQGRLESFLATVA